MVNNYDWLKDYTFLEFIRDVGKHITVGYMMAKDSVQKRLETGLSFYRIFLPTYTRPTTFYYLNKHNDVKLQFGGADQWGNITTGTELIRRMGGSRSLGFYQSAHHEGRWQQVWQNRERLTSGSTRRALLHIYFTSSG